MNWRAYLVLSCEWEQRYLSSHKQADYDKAARYLQMAKAAPK